MPTGTAAQRTPETLAHAKIRARSLLDAGKPVEAICALTHCLNGLGVPLGAIASRLRMISTLMVSPQDIDAMDAVRLWVEELEA